MKKRMIAAFLTVILCTGLTACGTASALPDDGSGKKQIVCTNFPEYDWTMHLLAGHEDEFEVTYLLKNGGDLHNYQPSAADMAIISGCDLLIYVGGESEQWVPDVLSSAVNQNLTAVRLLDDSCAVVEETVEGMEAEEDEDSEAPVYDEHIWLSLRIAARSCETITASLCELDSAHQSDYSDNCKRYVENLTALDQEFQALHDQSEQQTLIIADRFPFRYFVEDYGYKYYAAFAGCSAETEASFETIAFLARKADEIGASTIFTIEGGNAGIAEAVTANTQAKNQKIAVLNSIQSVSSEQIRDGATYLSLMEDNLQVLKEAAGLK